MNTVIKTMVNTETPKVGQIDRKEQSRYESGLILLSTFIREDFLDLPLLPEDKYVTEGLFYNIPFLHDHILYQNGRTQDLLVVYRIDNGASECPLRIDFEVIDSEKGEFKITLHDQSGDRTKKHILIERENVVYYTERDGFLGMTLSQLIAHFAS